MCLLIKQSKSTNFSDAFLTGVYTRNSDGIGIMWAEGGVLHMAKAVVTSAKDMIKFYREHAQGKECCVHFRMRTHGHIDIENCHPYPVFGFENKKQVKQPMLLMHNGVLTTGNHKDQSKSDTWHYVRDFLRPLLKADPALVHTQAFLKLIESHIGTNKFALMDSTGKAVLTNESQWIKYEGALLSNTYAWDYYGLHPDAKKAPVYSGGYQSGVPTPKYYGSRWYDDDYEAFSKNKPAPALPVTSSVKVPQSAVSLPTTGKHVTLPFEDEAILFAERVMGVSTTAFEALSKEHIERLFKEFGIKDIDAWIEAFEFGGVAEKEFTEGMKDPRKIRDWLNHPSNVALWYA